MSTLNTVELKAFVPARDFALSKQFYQDLGFTMPWSDDALASMHHGNVSFLLQNYYVKELADNLKILPPEQRPWKMRDFVVIDPSGVLWRIAENTP